MKIYRTTNGFRRAILASAFSLACMATLNAQGVWPGHSVTLRPVDTGRRIATFKISAPRTPFVGERLAVKTNLLYAVGLQSPNLSVEYVIYPRGSIEAAVGYNGWGNLWDYSKKGPVYDPNNHYKRRMDHLSVRAEYRHWFRGAFDGHFLGGGLFFARFRVGELKSVPLIEDGFDYYGRLFGVGFSYGYLWRWSRRWATEFSLGLGVAAVRFDKSLIMVEGETYSTVNPLRDNKRYFGPTNAAVKIVFFIK